GDRDDYGSVTERKVDQFIDHQYAPLVNVSMRRHRARHGREANQISALGDDAITGSHAVQHLGDSAIADSELDRTAHECLASLLYKDDRASGIIDDCSLGNYRRAAGRTQQQPQEDRLIYGEPMIAVLDFVRYWNRTGSFIDHLSDRDQAIHGPNL